MGPTEHPASTRSENTSEEVQGNLSHGPAENDNPNKNDDNEEAQGNLSHDLPEWLQEVKHGLVDGSFPEHRDASSSTLPIILVNQLQSREQKWCRAWASTEFVVTSPKDKDCEICKRTKITRASCRKRAGTVVPRAENFGDLTTADHKVLPEGCESRNNHRYAVVVQDLATQWIQ